MKKEFFNLILLIILFTSGNTFSQNDFSPPQLIPPSPEAASLFKFTDTPVTLSDGMASTSIPIYTIETKGVNIPIVLNYHSRGIKVAELASRVGLGWTLNFGGMISRQVRGKSDDGDAYGYLNQSFYSDFFTNESTRNSIYQTHINNTVDFDPDQFYFSFPGYSGKFIFDQVSKQPRQQKYSDLKISYFGDSVIEQWIIKDDKGNTFYFGQAPGISTPGGSIGDFESVNSWRYTNTSALLDSGAEDESYNSWHLLKIVTYNHEIITFTYEPENPQYIRRSYDETDSDSQTGVATYYSDVDATQYQIKRIDFPGGKVVFNKKTIPRLDLPASFALDNIEVYGNDNTLINRHNLVYQDVSSPTNNNYLPHLASLDPSSHKRMFLKEIVRTADGQNNPPYIFEYSNVTLPNRFSNSQDNWGYFNGANNGHFLTFNDYGSQTVNRRVDSLKNDAGLLKKVTYPTGGSVSFTYEQNVAVKPFFLDQTASPGNNPVVSKNVFLGHLMTQYFDSNSGSFKIPVSISENRVGSVTSTVKFTYDDGDGPCQPFQYTPDCGFLMMLKGTSGNAYGLNFGYNVNMSGVPSGEYVLEVFPPNGNPSIYFIASIMWEEEAPIEDNIEQPLMLASGKRIKKLTYSDGQGVIKTKEYQYSYPDGSNSGKIFGLPNFYSIMQETSIGNMLYKYGSKPGSPLTSLQGNDLGYSYVIEYEGTPTTNIGKTEYEFTNFSDGGTFYEFPYHLPIDNQWLRGKPLRTKFFKKSGSSYSIIKEVENVYLYGGESIGNPIFVSLQPFIHADSSSTSSSNSRYYQMPLAVFTPDDDAPDGHAFKVYYQLGGALDLHSTTEKSYLYNENGPQQVVSSRTNEYDYSLHYQLKNSSATAHGQTIESTYFYPPGTTFSSLGYENLTTTELSAVTGLKNANRLIPVQTQITVKEGTTVVGKLVQRTIFSNANLGLILPSVIKSAKMGDALTSRLTFHRYDNIGNILEVSQAGGPRSVYIWGYNKQYPVAKLSNTTYAAVEALSGFGPNFSLGSGGLSSTQESSLRSLPNALVTTYKYKPLVGTLSVIEPNGNKSTYDYDLFNRLEFIRDTDGNLLQQFKYNFKEN